MNSTDSMNAAFQKYIMKEYDDLQGRLRQRRRSTLEFAVGFILTTFVTGMLCVGAISRLPGLEWIMWPSLGVMGGLWVIMILIASVRTNAISKNMIKNQSKSNLAELHYDIHGVPERFPLDTISSPEGSTN